MIWFCVTRLAPLALAAGLSAGPAAAQDDVRPGSRPGTIVVPAPAPGEYYKVVPPGAQGGPPPGLYKRVTPLREGETPPGQVEKYMQAAPVRPEDPRKGEDRGPPAERAAAPAKPADLPSGSGCLSASDARRAIGSKRAVKLSDAARAAREAWDGEVIDYKLCNIQGLLTYDLTLLSSDGRVARARVDAGTGKLVNVK